MPHIANEPSIALSLRLCGAGIKVTRLQVAHCDRHPSKDVEAMDSKQPYHARSRLDEMSVRHRDGIGCGTKVSSPSS